MPSETQSKIPNPIYAAAGAGDMAIERLRKLPEKVAALQEELPGRLSVIQDRVTAKVAEIPAIVAELRQRVIDSDTDKLRESARRNATVLRTSAQNVSEKALAIYSELVARGESVLAGTTFDQPERIHAEIIVAEDEHTRADEDEVEAEVKAEAPKAASKKAEPTKAEPTKAEPTKAETTKAETTKAEPTKAEPKKASGKPRKAA